MTRRHAGLRPTRVPLARLSPPSPGAGASRKVRASVSASPSAGHALDMPLLCEKTALAQIGFRSEKDIAELFPHFNQFLPCAFPSAIYLVGAKAPALPIKTAELGSKFFDVKVGMTRKDLDAGLAVLYDFRELIEPEEYYRYYPDMGFGVRLDKGRVSEVVLAVVPRAELAQP
jgi:hypothetical protein